jgi:hypothetical protein
LALLPNVLTLDSWVAFPSIWDNVRLPCPWLSSAFSPTPTFHLPHIIGWLLDYSKSIAIMLAEIQGENKRKQEDESNEEN